MAALAQYTTPHIPAESPWINGSRSSASSLPAQVKEPSILSRKRPASRMIMRHVLRARAEAVRAVASFFAALDAEGDEKDVLASVHLARQFGRVEEVKSKGEDGQDFDNEAVETKGYRRAREISAFLRARGAKIPALEREEIGGEWTLSSEEEGASIQSEKCEGDEDLVWVPNSVPMD